MDNKSCYSSGDSSASSITTNSATTDPTATVATNRDHFLRHLNKLSHKISKPTSSFSSSASFVRRPPPDPPVQHRPTPPVPPLQQQPPVYNINKSDFRDVVQKLTGSPAHERLQTPPPPQIHAPKPASSRLQRIRPPPLAQLSNRPAPLLNCAIAPANTMNPPASFAGGFIRPPAPHSPLPPLPSCHAAAESPISAYMRFLHSSASAVDSDQKFNNSTVPIFPPPPQNPMNPPPADAFLPPPSSPLPPFGCLMSPKSPCPLLSPNLLFSPTGTGPRGFPQLPVSPTVSGVPSPKWRDL